MLRAFVAFIVLALFGLVLGASGMAVFTIDLARVIFLALIALAFVGVIVGFITGGHSRNSM